MRTTLQLLSLRARANWLLLAVLAAGILIAAVLLASTTLYSRALTDLGLDHRLEQEDGPVGAIRADLTGSQLAGRRAADVQAYAAASLDARFGDIALTTPPTPAADGAPPTPHLSGGGRIRAASLGDLVFITNPDRPGPAPPGAALTSISGYEEHVRVEGRLPAPPTLAPNPNTGLVQLQGSVEVALPRP